MIVGVPGKVSIYLVDPETGDPVESLTFSGAEVRIGIDGGAFADAAGTVTEDGGAGSGEGNYTYTADASDVVDIGLRKLFIDKAGAQPYIIDFEVVEAGGAFDTLIPTIAADVDDLGTRLPAALVSGRMDSSVGAMAAGAVNAIWAFAHESGRTAKGVITRLDALMTGRGTGLLGALATYFRADNTTKAIEAAQDTDAGTRFQASTISGD